MNQLKQIVFKIFDTQVKGADVYYNNGSTWLIFTDKKKWVFELTKEGTLWYNYYFFKNFLELLSLDVIENQNYITEWVEDTIQNRVKHTDWCQIGTSTSIDDTIQNGVKETSAGALKDETTVEDTIQNGVKKTAHDTAHDIAHVEGTIQNGVQGTTPGGYLGSVEMKGNMVHQFEHAKQNDDVEDTIQNGVKKTKFCDSPAWVLVENAIQNGVKQTHLGGKDRKIYEIKDIIENGVKETNMEEHYRLREVVQTVKNGIKNTINHPARPQEVVDNIINNGIVESKQEPSQRTWKTQEVIQNGVKETNPHFLQILNPMNFEPVIKEMKRMNEIDIVLENGKKETKTPNHHNAVNAFDFLKYNGADSHHELINRVIQNGIKEVKELPDKSGELKGYGEYYVRQKNRTYPHNDIVNDVISDGIKETKYCELHSAMSAEHIIRDGIKETWGYEKQPQIRVNNVLNEGIKQTNWRKVDNHPTYLDNIIKSNEK